MRNFIPGLKALALLAGLMVALAGCGTELPRGAANEGEILRGAGDVGAGFAVYPVTRNLLPSVAQWPRTGPASPGQWTVRRGGPAGAVIAAGDTVDLTIWDSAESSLLTTPGQKVVALSGVRVSTSGTIFVPYLDDIRVAGLTPDVARTRIQDQMEAIIPVAQVQLAHTPGRQSTVDLVGGVTSPGSYPLYDRNTTVLSLLAQGGGASTALQNPLVKLIRDGRTNAISLERLYADPGLDTLVRGGDKILLEEDRRYFIALGAAGTQDVVPFTRASLSALEALAEIGGLSERRANPEGVLVLREYPASALGAGTRGPREQRVVFTVDLTSAEGLFAAKSFEIMPGDLVLPTESPITNAQTIFSLIGSAFGLLNTATGGL